MSDQHSPQAKRLASPQVSTPLAPIESIRPTKPVVILLGWLGCQERHLNSFRRLYVAKGCDVWSYIAAPRMLYDTVLTYADICAPPDWPSHGCLDEDTGSLSMHEIAWKLLADLYHQQREPYYACDGKQQVVFHAFSNGGCFIWEEVQRIFQWADDGIARATASPSLASSLASMTSSDPSIDTARIVLGLKSCVNGIVFDSCPCFFTVTGADVNRALEQCEWQEKVSILRTFGPDLVVHGDDHASSSAERCHKLFDTLQNDASIDVTKLFVYSHDDPLASSQHIEQVVHNLRQLNTRSNGVHGKPRRKGPVLSQCWERSKHCGHLKVHPKEYNASIDNFLSIAGVVGNHGAAAAAAEEEDVGPRERPPRSRL